MTLGSWFGAHSWVTGAADSIRMDMTAADRTIRVTKEGPTPAIDSAELFGGTREIVIRHGAELYRLRLTNSNKLILIT